MKRVDAAVIGGGILGCFAARNLMRWQLSAVLLEQAEDVCTGITRANSAIVYPGYDNRPGSLKAEMTVRGNAEFETLCRELEVPFLRRGSLLVTYDEASLPRLRKKMEQGMQNGVPGLRLLSGREAEDMEPMLKPGVKGALYAPTTGTVNPWQLGIAAYESAVKNGVVLDTGVTVPKESAVAWVTGASAAAECNQSLTNTAYDGAVDVDVKYSKSEFKDALKAGEFVFYSDSGKARVLSDINSLVTYTPTKNSDFNSNRFIRVIDGWANDIAALFSDSYLGSVTNSDTGRDLFKADIVKLGRQYEEIDAISNFSADDITVTQGLTKRDVAVSAVLQPNDSMEKLYMTVKIV